MSATIAVPVTHVHEVQAGVRLTALVGASDPTAFVLDWAAARRG